MIKPLGKDSANETVPAAQDQAVPGVQQDRPTAFPDQTRAHHEADSELSQSSSDLLGGRLPGSNGQAGATQDHSAPETESVADSKPAG